MEVYKQIKRDLTTFCIVYVLVAFVGPLLPFGKDATDPPYGCSGMVLNIDAETGLHYLQGKGGVLTPRLDRDGNHMGEVTQ